MVTKDNYKRNKNNTNYKGKLNKKTLQKKVEKEP